MPSNAPDYERFVSLLARHESSVRSFASMLLASADGLDDVVQETALECWRKFDTFQPESRETENIEFVRWACVIAKFKVLSWQRNKARDRLVFRDGVIEALAAEATGLTAESELRRRAVENCLQELPQQHRILLLSVYAPGESVARIARETGQKARRLYSTLNRLRGLIQSCVTERLTEEPRHA
ncbi:MAG TPA: RNA polymerase factor sigma-70 [Planctomycetaceae bacterium]|nr:RNA polymerase factor sigma-70 [Planctomycetaceae bacterium]